MTHCTSTLIQIISAFRETLVSVADKVQVYEWFPWNYLQSASFTLVCKYAGFVCDIALASIADSNPRLDDQERFYQYVGHFPAGASLQDLDHYGQVLKAGRFQKYDYGEQANKIIYGSLTPPEYNLS